MLGDRVLRPARVIVAAAPAEGVETDGRGTSTRRSGFRAAPPRTRSRRPTASWRAATTPTPTPATRRPRSASRRSRAPTTFSPTPTSASSTTPSAPPARAWAAGPARAECATSSSTWAISGAGRLRRSLLQPLRRRRRRTRSRAGQRGRDIEATLTLSFEDSLRGAETRVPVEADAACSDLRWLGRQARHLAQDLPPVWRPRRRRREPGPVRHLPALPVAAAAPGMIVEQSLPDLPRLRVTMRRTKHYKVKIPPGVKDGTRIRLKGKGEPGLNGGPPGDLYVVTRVAALRSLRAPRRRPGRRGAGHLPGGRARGDRTGAHP